MPLLFYGSGISIIEKIREQEAFWARVMEAMPDVVYVIELDDNLRNRIVYRNRTLAALLAKGAVPEDLGEAAGPERLRDLLRALEPVSRNKM